MPKINLLTSEIYNKISAGEVVENPSSVVKELIENSIDAGASRIAVDVIEGGLKKIVVSDDGCGIEKDDLKNAFLPHATSKIFDENDLFNISTLGFRGEALPSIASVAKVRVRSRYIDSDIAYETTVCDGKFTEVKETALDSGTVIEIEDLFANVPARLKFMKKPKAEEANVTNIVEKLILAHPEIAFSYSVNGKSIYKTTGKSLADAFYTVYGKEAYDNRLEVSKDDFDLRLEGFICTEKYTKSNRNCQTLIVNGRAVTDSTISAVVQNAYGERLMRRNFPVFVLSITIAFDEVDVNVHPAKAEVRFKNSRRVSGAVYNAVKSALFNSDLINAYKFNDGDFSGIEVPEEHLKNDSYVSSLYTPNSEAVAQPTVKRESPEEFAIRLWKDEPPLPEELLEQERLSKESKKEEENEELPNWVKNLPPHLKEVYTRVPVVESKGEYAPSKDGPYSKILNNTVPLWKRMFYFKGQQSTTPTSAGYDALQASGGLVGPGEMVYLDEEDFQMITEQSPDFKILGQFANCYLIIEVKDCLYLFDQHAAHERLLYDQMMDSVEKGEICSQDLLVPAVIELSSADYVKISTILEELRAVGFMMEEFGSCCLKVSAVPAAMVGTNLNKFFDQLLAQDVFEKKITVGELLKERIIRTACKTALKAGQKLEDYQIRVIVENAIAFKDGYTCPHGRPLFVKFTLKEIEKMFKRIV